MVMLGVFPYFDSGGWLRLNNSNCLRRDVVDQAPAREKQVIEHKIRPWLRVEVGVI